MQRVILFVAIGIVNVLQPSLARGEHWRVMPSEFTLYGDEGRQNLAVSSLRDGRPSAAVPDETFEWKSANSDVVQIRGGVAVAIGDGTTTVTATGSNGKRATASVTVTGTDAQHQWSFRNDVQSVLARAGCNTGACHGALAGKGGFGLSLRGYDTEADFFTITREARGRRIEFADPGRSLLLAKPTGALPHKGGLRLDPESRDYRILAEWIASGAPAPETNDPRLESIHVLPESSLYSRGDKARILVQARYSDGRTIDVTDWSKFSSTDESIATVDEDGWVEVRGSGEGAVLVWFGSKVALARMTVPYEHKIAASVYERAARKNFIDDLNLEQLETLHLEPSPRCDDETFLRRATLDTIGRLPTVEEREAFVAGSSEARRDDLIERLLSSEDFVDYWAYRWSDMLLISGKSLRPPAVEAYYRWVHDAVRENMPWDQFVREILTSTGVSTERGATNFFALHQTPEEMTENACQAFLGLSIGCAKCHNHPLEKWTNDQYYAMANLFARVRGKGWGGDSRNGDGVRTVYVAKSGDLIQPSRGKPQPPAPLDSDPLPMDDPGDRRVALAGWMTDPDNPYFARSITNRIWANFFGRGLVEPVDDLRASNPATNEQLLTACSEHLVAARFDLQQLMRAILRSETYQRSSVPLPTNQDESKYLSRYYPRRLMAEVLLDSIDQVLETSSDFDEIGFSGSDTQKTDFYPPGTRAIELYDAAVESYFLKTFGRNPREITCECERSAEPSMVQVLHLSNGETLNPKLASDGNRLTRLLDRYGVQEDARVIGELYQAALVREPTDAELKRLLGVVAEYGDDRRTAIEDVAWSILSSTEFVFNH